MSGKLVRITHDYHATEEHWPHKGTPSLEKLQSLVGGYIILIQVPYLAKLRSAYVDEDALARGLPYNPIASCLYGKRLYGPIVIWIPDPKGKHK